MGKVPHQIRTKRKTITIQELAALYRAEGRLEEAREDPTGCRFTHCPKCDQWRGAALVKCPECGKDMPNIIVHEQDGTVYTTERGLCDECAEKHGGQPVDELGGTFEDE